MAPVASVVTLKGEPRHTPKPAAPVTDTIEKIGGARPTSFEQFVREQQNELSSQPAPAQASA